MMMSEAGEGRARWVTPIIPELGELKQEGLNSGQPGLKKISQDSPKLAKAIPPPSYGSCTFPCGC